mmetsp:Transcript_12011/g.33961  ORF Transcript_12011/g.33961 Transcript_12011/m.33961 type:complete len:147 (+) Transcript_12011:29-469(+)
MVSHWYRRSNRRDDPFNPRRTTVSWPSNGKRSLVICAATPLTMAVGHRGNDARRSAGFIPVAALGSPALLAARWARLRRRASARTGVDRRPPGRSCPRRRSVEVAGRPGARGGLAQRSAEELALLSDKLDLSVRSIGRLPSKAALR